MRKKENTGDSLSFENGRPLKGDVIEGFSSLKRFMRVQGITGFFRISRGGQTKLFRLGKTLDYNELKYLYGI